MTKAWHVIKHEFLEVLPPTIFFLITFHIVLIDRALMLREYGLQLSSMAAAAVMALLVAKVVLLADMLPLPGEAAHLQRGVEDGHLRGRLPLRALPGALHPPLVAHGKLHRRQSRSMARDRLAALLGHPALARRADLGVLRHPRARPHPRSRSCGAHLLRTSRSTAFTMIALGKALGVPVTELLG